MRAFWLALFLLIGTGVSGQATYNADSVEKIFSSLHDSVKIKEANNLMKHYMDVDFRKSMHYAREAFALADKVDNKADVAYTYISWAIAQYNLGDYDACLEFNFKALKLYQAMSDTVKTATVFNNISSAYNALGDYSTGAYYAYKAYVIHESKKNWRKAAISCVNLSSSFFESKDYPATLLWARKGYNYYQAAGQPEDLGYAIQIFIDVHIALKQIDSALFYLREVNRLNNQYPNEYLETVNQTQRGDVYALQGKYDSAIVMHDKCIRFYEEIEMSDGVVWSRLSIARAYMGLNNVDDAQRYALEAYTRSERIRNKQLMVKSSMLLADIFKTRHQFDRALHYAQLASIYKDSIMMHTLGGSIEGRFFDVKLEMETQEKLRAISTLKERNEVIGRQWRAIVTITLGLLVLAVITILIRRVGRYRQRMNEQLTASNRRLSELNHEINGLVNTIVHDLKSPLNSVQGILSLIEMTSGKNEEIMTLIHMANKSLNNGHDIIRQLLELRELEENTGQVNLTEIDISELSHDICESFNPVALQKEIVLTVRADHHRFTSDMILVRRVLDNLVSNALKFSPKGSEVSITAMWKNSNVVFQVSDKGPGFTDDDLQKIYGKFQKLSARPTGGENSSGLGLATVHALMRHLKGTIELKTHPGKGAVFTVTFPEFPPVATRPQVDRSEEATDELAPSTLASSPRRR